MPIIAVRTGEVPRSRIRPEKPGPDPPVSRSSLVAAALAAALAVGTISGTAVPLQPAAPLSSFDVTDKDIADLQLAMKQQAVTSRQLVEKYLARIEAYDQATHAIIALNGSALEQAAALDAERRAGHVRGPLHGIPLVLEDDLGTADMPTTGGARALEGFRTERDGFLVRRLREAGAVFIAKTNLDELAGGTLAISSMGGQTRNPYDAVRHPGGAGGGTAVAVAASFAAAGIAIDTCGSIRVPAANTNLWSLRPTMGLSSRAGLMPRSHSQDVAGPLARSAADLAVLLDATAGFDPDDPATAGNQGASRPSYLSGMGDSSLGDVRIGVLTSLFGAARDDEEVGRLANDVIDTLNGMGAGTADVTLQGLDALLTDTSTVDGEFKFDLMDFLGRYPKTPLASLDAILQAGRHRPEVDATLRRRNAAVSRDSESHTATLARRAAAASAIVEAMSGRGLTLLAYPTVRRKPARIGEVQIGSNGQLSATTGLPAMSVPAGFTNDGLPVGLELLGSRFSESTLLRVAYAYERLARPRHPPRSVPPLPASADPAR